MDSANREDVLAPEPPIVGTPTAPVTPTPDDGPHPAEVEPSTITVANPAAVAGSAMSMVTPPMPAPSNWQPLEETDPARASRRASSVQMSSGGVPAVKEEKECCGACGTCGLCTRLEPWAGLALLLGVILMGVSIIVLATQVGGSGSCSCECPVASSSSSFAPTASESSRSLTSLWDMYTSGFGPDQSTQPVPVSELDAVLAPDFEEECDWDPRVCPLNRSTVLKFHNRTNADRGDESGNVTYSYSQTLATNASAGMLCSAWAFEVSNGFEYLGCDVMRASASGNITKLSNFVSTPRITVDTIKSFTQITDECLRDKASQGDPSLPYPCRVPALRETLEAVLSPEWVGYRYNGSKIDRETYIQQLLTGSLHDAGELWLESGETFVRLDEIFLEQNDMAAHAFRIQVNVSGDDCTDVVEGPEGGATSAGGLGTEGITTGPDEVARPCKRGHSGMTLHRLGATFDARPWPPTGEDPRIAESVMFSSHRSP